MVKLTLEQIYKEVEKRKDIKELSDKEYYKLCKDKGIIKTPYYKNIKINGITQRESRFIYKKYFGDIPKGFIIHHKNFNTKDNRIENLELLKDIEHRRLHFKIRKENKPIPFLDILKKELCIN